MTKMLPPAWIVNGLYNLQNIEPGVPVEVSIRDIESLKAEGWISTEAEITEPEPLETVEDEYNGS